VTRAAPIERRRPAPRPPLFHSILIETRNDCQRRCWFCKFGQARRDPVPVEMDWAAIHRILANLRDLRYQGRISWDGINEPLLDPRIFEILSTTRQYCPEAFLSLATNGDRLTANVYARLKASGLDALGVSVYDDDTMARIRPLVDSHLVPLDMRGATPGRLDNRGGNVRQEADAFEAQRALVSGVGCDRPSTTMVVNSAGLVVLCCADVYADVVVGDVRQDRLEAIWNGERFDRYRRTLAASGRAGLPLCEACSYPGTGVRRLFPFADAVTD
jgi:MoaA/NifB/PqqE/SkfB family radical SAM enzyme